MLALRHAARQVDAVELDPNVPELLRGEFHDFVGGLYDRPEVRVHHAEARAFVQAAHGTWDVIDLSLVCIPGSEARRLAAEQPELALR